MTESNLNEQDLKIRQELFRYTDLTHPLMQTLFEIPTETAPSSSVAGN